MIGKIDGFERYVYIICYLSAIYSILTSDSFSLTQSLFTGPY